MPSVPLRQLFGAYLTSALCGGHLLCPQYLAPEVIVVNPVIGA